MSGEDSNTQYSGKVKWFNNKYGFGFITILNSGDSEMLNKDIFVHHSAIRVKEEIYKYLVQGEYVELEIVKTESKEHEFQAKNVGGMFANDLMCETRFKSSSTKSGGEHRTNRRTPRPVRSE